MKSGGWVAGALCSAIFLLLKFAGAAGAAIKKARNRSAMAHHLAGDNPYSAKKF